MTAAGRADAITNKALACEAHQGMPLKIVLQICANVCVCLLPGHPPLTFFLL